jgi:hypothetical protein
VLFKHAEEIEDLTKGRHVRNIHERKSFAAFVGKKLPCVRVASLNEIKKRAKKLIAPDLRESVVVPVRLPIMVVVGCVGCEWDTRRLKTRKPDRKLLCLRKQLSPLGTECSHGKFKWLVIFILLAHELVPIGDLPDVKMLLGIVRAEALVLILLELVFTEVRLKIVQRVRLFILS